MCRLLGVTKQAYYKHGDSDMVKIAQEAFVVEFIKDIRKKDPGIGGNKLWIMYQKQFGASRSVGYNRFYDIVEKYNLKVRKVKRRVKTTDSTHDLPLYPNIVKDLLPIRPCQLVVSDITYIPYFLDPVENISSATLPLLPITTQRKSLAIVWLQHWRLSMPSRHLKWH